MFPGFAAPEHRQTATQRIAAYLTCVSVSFLAALLFGFHRGLQAPKNILADRRISAVPAEIQPKLLASYGKLSLGFEVNQGQVRGPVKFLSRGLGYTIFLTPDEAVLALRKSQPGMSRFGKFGLPGRLRPFGPIDPRAGRWLAGALASPVNAGPQATTLPESAEGQVGLVTLRGDTRPEANATNDRGRVSDHLTLNHMMLPLQRTPEREQALQQFISEIHDPTSPHFHHWIAAAEFGQRYGVTPADVARVTDWLESRGFKVNLVYRNQMVIDFTGSAGQIRQAFHTEIHHLLVNGQAHIANMSDAQISAALTSTVAACPIQIAYVRLPLGYRAWARKCKNEPQTTEHRESRGGEH